jgi:hypothetical protein
MRVASARISGAICVIRGIRGCGGLADNLKAWAGMGREAPPGWDEGRFATFVRLGGARPEPASRDR